MSTLDTQPSGTIRRMSSDERATDVGIEFDLPFGGGFRIFEAGFFAVLFVFALTAIVLTGVGLLAGEVSGVFRPLLVAFLGSIGVLVSVAGGLNALQLLRDERPALQVSEAGILNRTYWSATRLVPWNEVIDVRPTRFSWISEIVLADPEAFRSRQVLPIRIMMRVTSLFGIGSLPVYLPQFAASREEVSRRLTEVLEARELAAIREHRRLGTPVEKGQPSAEHEEHTA